MKHKLSLTAALLLGLVVNFFGQEEGPSSRRAPPALISPEINAELDNGCEDKTIKNPVEWNFKWSSVPKARRYELYVIGANAKFPIIDNTTLTTASYERSDRNGYITDYNRRGWRWKVRVLVGTLWSDWSEERTFNVEPVNTDCR